MKKKLTPAELKIINSLEGNVEIIAFLTDQIKSIKADYISGNQLGFDPELFNEFIKDNVMINIEKLDETIRAADEKNYEISKEMAKKGSPALTFLISDYLSKIEKEGLTKEKIRILKDLIDCRNQMQTIEKDYISKKYKEFLEKQITLKIEAQE